MDSTTSQTLNNPATQRNPCSLNDALNSVDRNLIYDPITKKLCLKTFPIKKNKIPSNHSNTREYTSIQTSSINDIDDVDDLKKDVCANDDSKTSDLLKDPCNDIIEEEFNIHLVKRPHNLPPKNKNEEQKHRAQFLEIIQHAKSKDLKEKKLKKDISIKQQQQENDIQKAIKTWTDDILPRWSSTHITKRVQDLWWNGIPSSIRPKVWNLVIGNDLNITDQLFHICVKRSKEKIWTKQFLSRRSSNPMSPSGPEFVKTHRRTISSHSFNIPKSKDLCGQSPFGLNRNNIVTNEDEDEDQNENVAFLIKLDVRRTFPQLGLFQEMGPYHESLCDILSAYVVYRPDIGYCQGMSFLAAMLLLNSQSPSSAFTSLANLLNNELLLAFYGLNQQKMQTIYNYYDRQFNSLLPNLARHFSNIGLTTDLFFMYQVYTIFARSLSLDCASRVWDLFLRDGNEFIFRASLGILSMYQKELIKLEFIDSARFLSNLPEDMDIDKYFETIASIKLIPPKLSVCLLAETENNLDCHSLSSTKSINTSSTLSLDNPATSTISTTANNNNNNQQQMKSRYSSLINKFLRL